MSESGVLLKKADVPMAHLARRREPMTGWPGVSAPVYQVLSDTVCEHTGNDEFVGLTMCEPKVRAAISVFKASEQQALVDVFTSYYPTLLKRLMTEVKLRPLRIEVGSKMGGPYYERRDDKVEILEREVFPKILAGELSFLDNQYTIVNIRLSAEKQSKIREVPIIRDGVYQHVKITGQLRGTKLGSGTFAARARPVYNPNVANNYKQVVDNSLHDVILGYAPFKHDMYKRKDTDFRLPGFILATDVKHFERCVGSLVAVRATFIGGKYNELQQLIASQPYLCSGDNYRHAYFVSPVAGYLPQLASGDSCVAAIAKETLIVLYASYFAKKFRLTKEAAIDMALNGGDPKHCAFLNYGDDNLLYGHRKDVIECKEYLSQFLTIEIEDPAGLIGWEYNPTDGFFLRDQSCTINFWKPERPPGPPFRPYFYLGFYLRYRTFRKYGSVRIKEIEEKTWETMLDFGLDRKAIDTLATREAEIVGSKGLPLNYVLGKNYMLTDAEKDALGSSKHISYQLTHQIFNDLVSEPFRKAG